MEDPKPQPEPIEEHHLMQTYENDLAKAMNTTDATVVAELLDSARTREATLARTAHQRRARGWYVIISLLFILIAAAASVYGVYHYLHLTVPVQQNVSVGVFPTTTPIDTTTTDITQTVATVVADATLPSSKPTLVPLLSDSTIRAPLSVSQFFAYINANPSEPFVAVFSLARLGVVNLENRNVPFIIGSVPNVDVASKELLIAEPDLVRMFYHALNIDLTSHQTEVGKGFTSEYMYNLPVRVLRSSNPTTGESSVVLLYGYVSDNTVVITDTPLVLKAVYDTIIAQQ